MPHFDYCSTLFFNCSHSILLKCFKKNIKLFLNIDIHNKDDLSVQLTMLERFNILPLSLRIFTHYCSFLHSLFFNQVCLPLINLFKKTSTSLTLRMPFLLPSCEKNYGKHSLVFTGTKFLNLFIYSYFSISKKSFKEYLLSNALYYYKKLIT